MKTIKIVLAIATSLGVLLFLGTCATTRTPLPTDNIDELLGTWVNPDYDGLLSSNDAGKVIVKEDGTAAFYDFIKGGNPGWVEPLDVKEKWTDRKGAVYFKINAKVIGRGEENYLIKIGSDRKTLEMLVASRMDLLPSDMDIDAPYCTYWVWYRQ